MGNNEILSSSDVFALLRARAIDVKRKVFKTYHNRFQAVSLESSFDEASPTLAMLARAK